MPLDDQFQQPKHIAIIMDGNGRWARKRLMPRSFGHQQGVATVRMVVEQCLRKKIPYLTLFAFSTENWRRPEDEVGMLFGLFEKYLQIELKSLAANDVCMRFIGERESLPERVRLAFDQAEAVTAHCKSLTLTLAISYGARSEIVTACKKISTAVANGELASNDIDENLISNNLYTKGLPDPDLLIRTSLEYRISNFLLWQLAYSELVFVDKLWPEFSEKDFERCLDEFNCRSRRFGATQEQVETVK